MPAIFISYRRSDSAGQAGRLYDRLTAHFTADRVFMDVDDIQPGEDFVQKLEDTERACSVLLVVIGQNWLSPRLNDPQDFVRREITSGLSAPITVIPILVQGAQMPNVDALPAEMAALARRNATEISDAHFQRDAAELITRLDPLISSATVPSVWLGTWHATVEYSWGDSHDETFKFELDDDELLGTASYVATPRTITDGKVTDKKISFVTKSLSVLGDKTYEEKHTYSGKWIDGKISFRLQTETGYDTRPPETFTAARLEATPKKPSP